MCTQPLSEVLKYVFVGKNRKGLTFAHMRRAKTKNNPDRLYGFLYEENSELQIRGAIEDNSKIIFLISQQKHML